MVFINQLSMAFVLGFIMMCTSGRSKQQDIENIRNEILLVNVPLKHQSMLVGKETIRYRLSGIVPGRGYEVRVSHPSINPVSMSIWIENGLERSEDDALDINNQQRTGRKLLDADKIIFRTDESGHVLFGLDIFPTPIVALRSERRGLSLKGPEGSFARVQFDIVLEESYLGVPLSAIPLIFVSIFAVMMIWWCLPWWNRTAVPCTAAWLISYDGCPGSVSNPIEGQRQNDRRTSDGKRED